MLTAQDMVAKAKETISEVSVPELAQSLDQGKDIVLIDIREPAEFEQGHLPGAVNIPRGVLEFQVAAHPALACELTAPELAQRDREICLYCRSGGRSALGALSLEQMGFRRVSSLAGGYLDWQAHDLPTQS